MTWELVIQMDVTPIAQPRPRVTRFGAYVLKNHPVHGYRNDIIKMAFKERERYPEVFWPVREPVEVVALFLMPKMKGNRQFQRVWASSRPDLDNLLKGSLDACKSVIWHDDVQVVSLKAVKVQHADLENPRLTMYIRPAPDVEASLEDLLR